MWRYAQHHVLANVGVVVFDDDEMMLFVVAVVVVVVVVVLLPFDAKIVFDEISVSDAAHERRQHLNSMHEF